MNTTPDDAAWRRLLAPYKKASRRRALIQVVDTVLPYAAIWAAMVWSVMAWLWLLAVPLAVPAAGLFIRLFIIQHDCGHGSFFRSPRGQPRCSAPCSAC